MKTMFLLSGLLALLLITGCQNNSTTTVDAEKEKAAIEKILNQNADILISSDKEEAVKFYRKYNLPEYYIGQNSKVLFYNFADSSDQTITAGMNSQSVKGVSWSYETKPVIRISSDGKMASALGKVVLIFERDSSNTMIKMSDEIVFMQIFEKSDSIWKMGDYVQMDSYKRIK